MIEELSLMYILDTLNLKDDEILNIYMYGSRVYGCNLLGDYDRKS